MIMRYGFTTGSCAAAASKAAAYMLLTGKAKNKITIQTPKGIAYTADITDIKRSENEVSCAVIKDGGDDPDVTPEPIYVLLYGFCIPIHLLYAKKGRIWLS